MIDLHTHSTASDGADTPSCLLEKALQAGLKAIALTDHDTVSGIEEFLESARGKEIEGIPGVELSCYGANRELHIVGLFVDHTSPDLLAYLEKMRNTRNTRNEEMLARINAIGYSITKEEVLECAGGESVGRPHFAQALIKRGYFEDTKEVFERLLKRGRRAYVSRFHPPVKESIDVLHAAGGIAIWAHPISLRQEGCCKSKPIRKALDQLKSMGLDGMEVVYSQYTPLQEEMLKELAREYDLLPSGGSDYHGHHIPGIEPGVGKGELLVPDSFLDLLKEARNKRK